MSLAYKIRRLREGKNYTQEYMSERLNISQNTYSKIETGGIKLTVDRLQQIADILEVPIDTIFVDDNNQSFNFNNSHIEKFYGYIETLQEDNKELVQMTTSTLIQYLEHLQEENKKLVDIISNLTK